MFGRGTKRAETRQAFAALRCLGERPLHPFARLPRTPKAVRKYIRQLDWRNPWGASSHVSHLLFFLSYNQIFFPLFQPDAANLISVAIADANRYRQKDGSWYLHGVEYPAFQKVNSAMKILTGFDAAGVQEFSGAEPLIDLCLSTDNTGNACNNLNIIFVLYYCSLRTNYRMDEIQRFCLDRLSIYRKHYWPEYGGFSFYERKANSVFYDARISLGKEEPDIHGTVLLLWGISMMSRILGIDRSLHLRIPFT